MRTDSNAASQTRQALIDANEVCRALRLLCQSRHVTELRVLDAVTSADRWPHTATGYFDDAGKLVAALDTIKSAKGFYIIPNAVKPALLARAANRLKKAGKGDSTGDNDIIARRWLLIDCDPQRPAGISSTDAEHEVAIKRAEAIRDALRHNYGWPEPIQADSGNGTHLLYRIDVSVNDDGLLQHCLTALAAQFDDDDVKIDQTVFNPARIWKLYGTLACKGDNTPDRPHQMSRILCAPDPIQVVDHALLEALAAEAPAAPPREPQHVSKCRPFDIDSFIAQNGFDVDGPDPWQGGRRWVFRRSPMCEHHDGAAFLIQHASGALVAKCHHNSCMWGWHDLRTKFELQPPQHTTNGRGNGFSKNTKRANPTPSALVVEAYKRFPVEVLPGVVGEFVCAAAVAIGCDPSFIALPLLVCLACAIGNKRVVRLKRTWTEPAIIWAAIVGKSGTHKTPAIQAAMQFLQRKQNEAFSQHDTAAAHYEQEMAIYERDYGAWKRSRKSGPTEPPPEPPAEPVCQRYITTDTTIEALALLLKLQYDGLLVSRDELAGWLGGIAEYKGGKGSDLGHWLASWSGAPLTVDRKTGAIRMIHVPRAAVSIIGGIQPGVLKQAIGREHLQDGLCARLLLAMPELKPVRWSEAIVDSATETALANVFERLLALKPGVDEDGHSAPRAMPLTDGAKSVWTEYYDRHSSELVVLDDDLAAAWSKLRAYTARFALIFQLCSWAADEQYAMAEVIDEAAMHSAIALSDWFGGEARRVYGMFAESEADREYRELVELIRRRGGRITARELARSCRRYRGSGEAEAVLDEVAGAGYGAWDVVSTATSQRREFYLTTAVTVTDSRQSRETSECDTVTSVTGQNGHDPDAVNQMFAESWEGDDP